MLKIGLVTAVILVGALLTSSSGGAARVPFSAAGNSFLEQPALTAEGPGDELREEFHQTYPLDANGRVSLENLNGGVRIGVWDQNEVKVDAIKRAYKKERLDEVKIQINSSADAIRIKTTYPDYDQTFTNDERGRYNNPAVVDYTITVPRKARLESVDLINGSLQIDGVEGDVKASSVNGRITAHGLMGEAKLSTVNGPLEAVFTQLTAPKSISLGSVNGGVVLIIPSDSNATLKAGTVHGGINNEFGLEVQHGDYVGHELYGQVGSGGARIKLGNVNGSISIKHAQDGRQVSSATSLLSQKDKDKNRIYTDKELGNLDAQSRQIAEEARREALANIDTARITREAQAETRREVERAIREAQREIERAQIEVQRETARQAREQVRREARGEGIGAGESRGEGTGGRRSIVKETKSFAVSGTPRVNIGTFDGAIHVHGWDKPEVMYTAVKRGREEEAKGIVIQADQQGSSLSIIAKSDGDGSASLDVYVPRSTNLHVSSDDGRLSLAGVSGDLTLRTGDGSIEVADSRGQLQVNTGDGHISITNFEGQVDARTGDGAISLDGTFIGLAARTGDGSISLSTPRDSQFTIETNADAIDNQGLTVSEDIAPSKRVKRWKVGGGGKVFILSTGEGHIVLRPR